MSIKWTERRFSKSLQLQEQKDFLARKNSILPSEPLEDMVSCPIHLGIFEDPIQLPCGHSYCFDCVDRCLKTHMLSNNKFACPVCRIEWPVPLDGARGWPCSYALNDIIVYVKDQKALKEKKAKNKISELDNNNNSNNQKNSKRRRDSVLEKADLVKKLLANELNESGGESIDKEHLIAELNKILNQTQESTDVESNLESIGNGTRKSSFDNRCDVEIVRQQMSRQCHYRVYVEPLPLNSLVQQHLKETLSREGSGDCLEFEEERQYKKLVLVTSDNKVAIHDLGDSDEISLFSFTPQYESNNVKPVFIKLYQDTIYISGIISSGQYCNDGIVLKYNLDGKQIHCSECFPQDGPLTNELPVAGIDLDKSGRVFVAHPNCGAVSLLSNDLSVSEDRFVFASSVGRTDNNDDSNKDEVLQNDKTAGLHSPYHVCYCSASNELWVSCPSQSCLIILDVLSSSFMRCGTNQLYGSSPGPVVCTHDNRVCFLDRGGANSGCARIFWIKKHAGYLCIQRLDLQSVKRGSGSNLKFQGHTELRAISHSNSLLLVSSNCLYVAKPNCPGNSFSSKANRNNCCMVQ